MSVIVLCIRAPITPTPHVFVLVADGGGREGRGGVGPLEHFKGLGVELLQPLFGAGRGLAEEEDVIEPRLKGRRLDARPRLGDPVEHALWNWGGGRLCMKDGSSQFKRDLIKLFY